MDAVTPAPGRAWNRIAIGGGAAVGADHPALREHLLDAGAVGERGDLVLQGGQLLDVGLDDRPDLHPHVVGVELAPGRAARRTDAADRLEAVLHGPLRVGQAGDPAVLVADDGELTDLGQGDEPPVGGVLPCDALVEEHVLGRLDAGDVEVAQPPEVEPATDHRVHAADEVVLDDPVVGDGTVGEVGDRRALAGADRHRDPAYVVGEGQGADDAGELLAGPLRRLGCVRPVHVEVDDHLVAGGAGGDLVAERPRPGALPGSPSSARVPTVETTRVGRSSRT